MKRLKILGILLIVTSLLKAQDGKLLIIGGGYENISSTSSWNYEAFNWAVEQSENKKIAFLHYSSKTTSEFENYFIDQCGAVAAKSFIINSNDANNPTLIDEISQYDVFYLRGGDQWRYYDYWRGKLIEDAIHEKFNQGGVICGTSAGLAMLSKVMFTAKYSGSYSDLCIKNTNHVTITLKDNFIEFMPGFIFDSHFTERGRMGRLVSFMAHWKKNKGENITGIGVDEITALAIESNGNAKAYGAGSVNIFSLRDESNFGDGTALTVDSLRYIKLIHGKTVNLNNLTTDAFTELIVPEVLAESNPTKIYASGADDLNETNENLLKDFIKSGKIDDSILIFTGSDIEMASKFEQKLHSLSAPNVKIITANNTTANDDVISGQINSCSKFIFVDNNSYDFFSLFLNGGSAGTTLRNAITLRSTTLAFIGDNARFCGSVLVGNYLGKYANANLSDGLKLLKNLVIIPRTYERANSGITDLWHASNSSLPYAMVESKVPHGVWLNSENYIVYKGENDKAVLTIHGSSPAIILSMDKTSGERVSQTYSGTGSPDKKAGFDKMHLSFLSAGQQYCIGEYKSELTDVNELDQSCVLKLYPNPVSDRLNVFSTKGIKRLSVYNSIGVKIYEEECRGEEMQVDMRRNEFRSGVYFFEFQMMDEKMYVKKIIKK